MHHAAYLAYQINVARRLINSAKNIIEDKGDGAAKEFLLNEVNQRSFYVQVEIKRAARSTFGWEL